MNISSSLSYCTTSQALNLFKQEVGAQLVKVEERLPSAINKVRQDWEVVSRYTSIKNELLELKNSSQTCKKGSRFRFIQDRTGNEISFSKLPTLIKRLTLCESPHPLLKISESTFEHLCKSDGANLGLKHSQTDLSRLIDHKIECSEGWINTFKGWLETHEPVLTELEAKKSELTEIKSGLASGRYKVTDDKEIDDTTKIKFMETIDKLTNNPSTASYITRCMNIGPLNDHELREALSLLNSSEGSPGSAAQNERLRATSLLTDSAFAARTLYASCEAKRKTSAVLEKWNDFPFAPLKPTVPSDTILE